MHFPRTRRDIVQIAPGQFPSGPQYTFTSAEMEVLCRWYSALKYAFPEAEAFMVVSHKDRYSMVAISNINGRATPTGMLFKHVEHGRAAFSWLTEADTAIGPTDSLDDITNGHIAAVACPSDEALWLDHSGWMRVVSERTVYEPR
jgi:hypothetical protein